MGAYFWPSLFIVAVSALTPRWGWLGSGLDGGGSGGLSPQTGKVGYSILLPPPARHRSNYSVILIDDNKMTATPKRNLSDRDAVVTTAIVLCSAGGKEKENSIGKSAGRRLQMPFLPICTRGYG